MSKFEQTRHYTVELGTAPQPARVTLVGAGPGDPELLTLKAARVLAAARIVLYDHLVSKEVLRLVPPGADLVYVGKESSHHTLPQGDIVELMLRLARSGRPVVRLKGGDPYTFGRGGEEAQALAEAGVPFEVVPGISAAQGAAACAGIPLTHRDHASSVHFVTGHLRAGARDAVDLDWPALVRPRQTLVVYMGLASLPVLSAQLIHHGMDPRMPAALIERATLPTQRTLVGTLQSLPSLAQLNGIGSPALIVIGSVVDLSRVLAPAAGAGDCASIDQAQDLLATL
jgi:uroporphyrin-III C-methyltransferase